MSTIKNFFKDDELVLDANDLIIRFDAELKENSNCFHLNYENGRYREKELANLIWDSIPLFALTSDEYDEYIANGKISRLQRSGLNRISKAKKNSKGDYGELLLFLILEIFESAPKFVTKVKLRSSKKDQIKGYDCAHFTVDDTNNVKLWLGEAKFHQQISGAVEDAIASLESHFTDDFIKDEIDILFDNIVKNSKVDSQYYDLLIPYLRNSKPLDDVPIHVPVLLTYDSHTIKKGTNHNDGVFKEGLLQELNARITTHITNKTWPTHRSVTVSFYLFPLSSVKNIKDLLEAKEHALR